MSLRALSQCLPLLVASGAKRGPLRARAVATLLFGASCVVTSLHAGAQDAAAAPTTDTAAATGANFAVLRSLVIDPAVADQVLTLDPDNVSDADVRDVLARAPAPRIMLLHGSVPLITMRQFAFFLVDMGYPKSRLVNPPDGAMSLSSYTRGKQTAGTIAWHFEHDGMMPLLIGHSQGGVAIVSALLELSGTFSDSVPVYDPVADETLARTTIIDPLTGLARPVVGLRVPFAAALATGKLMRLVLGQWDMINRLHNIPDSVDEFTAFLVPGDVFTASWLTGPDQDRYRAIGSANVRNVILPRSYGHVTLPQTRHLANNPTTRAWINAYRPDQDVPPLPADPDVDVSNIVHAADIWFSIKRHWVLAAQEVIRAQRTHIPAGH